MPAKGQGIISVETIEACFYVTAISDCPEVLHQGEAEAAGKNDSEQLDEQSH